MQPDRLRQQSAVERGHGLWRHEMRSRQTEGQDVVVTRRLYALLICLENELYRFRMSFSDAETYPDVSGSKK